MPRIRRVKLVQQGLFGTAETLPAVQADEPMLMEFSGHPIRLLMIDGSPWWVLSDVVKVLGYQRTSDAVKHLRDKHKGTAFCRTPGGSQEILTVNEAGLYETHTVKVAR